MNKGLFYHGIAKAKENIGNFIKKDEEGVITAYLPYVEEGESRFAVWFSKERWYTFQDNEEWFLNHFERIME